MVSKQFTTTLLTCITQSRSIRFTENVIHSRITIDTRGYMITVWILINLLLKRLLKSLKSETLLNSGGTMEHGRNLDEWKSCLTIISNYFNDLKSDFRKTTVELGDLLNSDSKSMPTCTVWKNLERLVLNIWVVSRNLCKVVETMQQWMCAIIRVDDSHDMSRNPRQKTHYKEEFTNILIVKETWRPHARQ